MSILDRAIEAVSPHWAARRALARIALTNVRAYDAAKPGRGTDSWRRPSTSAPAEVAGGAGRVRDAARDLVRNNGYAQRALATLVSSTVGTGITGVPVRLDGKDVKPATAEAWARFVDGCDHDGHHDLYGLQNLAVRTKYESGEALIRYHRQAFGAGEKLAPVRLQVLEPDYVDVVRSARLNGETGFIDRGIEYDAAGRKTALWLLPDHPGNITPYLRSKFESVRVPIGEVEQVYQMLRPGQDRGISIFAAAVLPLKALADFLDAEAMRKRLEACIGLLVTSPDATLGIEVPGDGAKTDASGRPLSSIAPGMIARLKTGETVEAFDPKPSTGGSEVFVSQMQFLAAAAGGVMFEHMTGNFSNVNYSSYRVGSFDFARQVEQVQWLTLRPRLNAPIGNRFFEAATAAGIVREPGVAITWTPPSAVTSPDPLKDANADQANMRNGTLSLPEAIERRGWTLDEMMKAHARGFAASDLLEVQFDSDARKNLKAPAAPDPAAPAANGGN